MPWPFPPGTDFTGYDRLRWATVFSFAWFCLAWGGGWHCFVPMWVGR